MNNLTSSRFLIIAGMITLAVLSRLLPHPDNFSPLAAVALFGATYFSDKKWAFIVPVVAMIISDAVIGFHALSLVVYGCFAATALLGVGLLPNRVSPLRVAGAALLGTMLFFVVTNFAVWAFDPYQMYAHDAAGLTLCFVNALPFLAKSLLGDMFYTGLLFGSFALLQEQVPALRA